MKLYYFSISLLRKLTFLNILEVNCLKFRWLMMYFIQLLNWILTVVGIILEKTLIIADIHWWIINLKHLRFTLLLYPKKFYLLTVLNYCRIDQIKYNYNLYRNLIVLFGIFCFALDDFVWSIKPSLTVYTSL